VTLIRRGIEDVVSTMHIDQILFSLASFLFILMPIMSWVSTIIAVVLPGAKQPLGRIEFQDKVVRRHIKWDIRVD